MSGLLSSGWDQYIPADLPDEAFGDLSRRMQYQPLNFKKLIDAGAIRITQPGSGTGPEPTVTDDPNLWSLVSLHNDRAKNSYTPKWPTKPEAVDTALSELQKNNDFLYDGKYRQILWSARELGLKPEDVFLKKRRDDAGLLGGG
jgi:hypothetical protein